MKKIDKTKEPSPCLQDMKQCKCKRCWIIWCVCVVAIIFFLIYASSFSVVKDARRVMKLEGVTGTALDRYADDYRTEENSYGKATIIPLAVVPNNWNTSTVWVWYEQRIFNSDGNRIAGGNAVARWVMEREHGQWKVVEVYEPDPTTKEGQQYFWVRLLM